MPSTLSRLYYVAISLCLLGLSGCASTPSGKSTETTAPVTWEQRQQQLMTIRNWTLAGAISIRTEADATSASLNWQQQGNHYQIRLFGPLGAGQIQLKGTPHQATLIMQKETVSAASPEQLFLQQTGWYMPVTNLLYWVRGIPSPYSVANVTQDESKRAHTIIQDGWTIRYDRFRTIKGQDFPTKIQLSSGEIQIRLVINRWQI
ncbi:MAG: outer membrane lipoprotein LolB [Legionellales bacterium]|nr:outer membrane lipoprotein LolB [Legionellales bacterium]